MTVWRFPLAAIPPQTSGVVFVTECENRLLKVQLERSRMYAGTTALFLLAAASGAATASRATTEDRQKKRAGD